MRIRAALASIAFLVCILLALPTQVAAKEPEARFELFAEFGGSFYDDKSEWAEIPFLVIPPSTVVFFPARRTTSVSSTGRLFAGLRYYFTRNDAFEASFSYSPSDFSETDLVPGLVGVFEVPTVFQVRASSAAFNYVRYVRGEGRWRPFVTGGLGFTHFDGLPSATKFSGNFGAGTDIALNRRLALRAEYRLFLMPRPELRGVLLGDPGSLGGVLQNHVPSIGIVVRF